MPHTKKSFRAICIAQVVAFYITLFHLLCVWEESVGLYLPSLSACLYSQKDACLCITDFKRKPLHCLALLAVYFNVYKH